MYDTLLDNILIKPAALIEISDHLLPENITVTAPRLFEFINVNITPIQNRLKNVPVTKATLSKEPKEIIPILRYILNIYENQYI